MQTVVATCPKCNGKLRRDGEGFAVCLNCGYEEPLEDTVGSLAKETKREGKKLHNYRRYHKSVQRRILLEAVADLKRGLSREEVCKKVGCSSFALHKWIEKYGEAIRC